MNKQYKLGYNAAMEAIANHAKGEVKHIEERTKDIDYDLWQEGSRAAYLEIVVFTNHNKIV
jgi:hypothetical protein